MGGEAARPVFDFLQSLVRLTFQQSAAPAEPASILVVSTIHCANGVPEMCEHGKRSARLWD